MRAVWDKNMNQLAREIEFLLYEFVGIEQYKNSDRFQEFNRNTIDAILDTSAKVAETYFAPYYQKGDQNEPQFVDGNAITIPETKTAFAAIAEAGLLSAHHDYDWGGMQMPALVQNASMAHFFHANIALAGYPFLTIGSANLIRSFGTDEQKSLYLPPMLDGRFAGTMALTEPNQGSSLADITTTAYPQPDGSYRLVGNKIYISGGDQDITENIIHLVLAKIDGAPAGVSGISLFICPKVLLNDDGSLGARNDVALAGLLHKMGYRQTTSTALNFGENNNCKAFLIGKENHGLAQMFQMMNEARINVGLGAAALGLKGYYASLDYAKNRPQGRNPKNKDPSTPQLPIIEHADVKRMLLAQKAYSEGALALCLYATSLVDQITMGSETAELLLDFLTPIVKTFSSEYCVKANELAIQVLGGAGYIREYPLEQIYRDNRLNPIHEGTTGIQGIDLLGRKLRHNKGASFRAFLAAIDEEINRSPQTADLVGQLIYSKDLFEKTSDNLLNQITSDPEAGLANASVYLDMTSKITIAWMWLKAANRAHYLLEKSENSKERENYLLGKIQAANFYFNYELPQVLTQCELLNGANTNTLTMQPDWF